jgi:CO/xanthine dehydrogenase Mo-binding subunit
MFDGEKVDPKRALLDGFVFDNFGIYVFGAHAIEVEVDCATGRVEVLRAWCAHDVGKAINPVAVEGQIQGAFVQGLGYALFEEMVWDDGRLANPSFMDYRIPGTLDVPADIIPIIIEDPEPTGPFGAKGIGEPGLVPVAPAIANAVHAATGRRLRALPLTAEAVLDALGEDAG